MKMDLLVNNKKKKTKMRNHISNGVFSITIVIVFLISCQNESHKNIEFSYEEIDKKVSIILNQDENGENIELNIADLTPFKWDELYIFKPYTSIVEINESLGFEWEKSKKTAINYADGFNLLIFIEKSKVIHYINWPRNKGDFSKIEKPKFSNDSAKFILKKEKIGNQNWKYFYAKE